MEYIISLEGPITHGGVVLKLFLHQSLGQADYMDWFSRQLCVVQGGASTEDTRSNYARRRLFVLPH